MRASVLLFALFACDEADPGDDLLPVDAAPPPLALTVGTLMPGHVLDLSADGAPVGATVTFVYGARLGTTCPPPLSGTCLGVASPTVIAWDVADAHGHAELNVLLPVTAPVGVTIPFQAAIGGAAPQVSNVVTRTIQSLCGDGILTADEDCDDGGTVAGDGCSATCAVEVATFDTYRVTLVSARIDATAPGGSQWDDYAIIPPFTNPDPFVQIMLAGVIIGQTSTAADDLTPTWNASTVMDVYPGDLLELGLYDEDVAPLPNELIRRFTLNKSQLDGALGMGNQTFSGGPVQAFTIRVETP